VFSFFGAVTSDSTIWYGTIIYTVNGILVGVFKKMTEKPMDLKMEIGPIRLHQIKSKIKPRIDTKTRPNR